MKLIEQLFILIFQMIESIFRFFFDMLEMLISGFKRPNKEYNAEFASASILLSSWNQGFCLTGRSNLTVKQSYQNALIIGSTGTGKSSIVLSPSLYTMHSSFIVHDPSGELYEKCGGALQHRGIEGRI